VITAANQSFLTYVWHYLLARLLYDDLIRPLLHGGAAALVGAIACVAVAVWLWRRRVRRPRGRRIRGPRGRRA
jgi:hypothetical protein